MCCEGAYKCRKRTKWVRKTRIKKAIEKKDTTDKKCVLFIKENVFFVERGLFYFFYSFADGAYLLSKVLAVF